MARARTNVESAALSGPGWVRRQAAVAVRPNNTAGIKGRYLFQLIMDGIDTWSMLTG